MPEKKEFVHLLMPFAYCLFDAWIYVSLQHDENGKRGHLVYGVAAR